MRKKFISKKKTKNRMKFFLLFVLVAVSFSICLSFFSSFLSQDKIVNFLLRSNLDTTSSTVETDLFDFLLDYTIGRQEFKDEEYDGSTSTQESSSGRK